MHRSILKSRSTCKKTVSFCRNGTADTVQVFEADEYDRTPVQPTQNLTRSDILELEELQISLYPNSRPHPQILCNVPITMLPLQDSHTRKPEIFATRSPHRPPTPPSLHPSRASKLSAFVPLPVNAPTRATHPHAPPANRNPVPLASRFQFMPVVPVLESSAPRSKPPSPPLHNDPRLHATIHQQQSAGALPSLSYLSQSPPSNAPIKANAQDPRFRPPEVVTRPSLSSSSMASSQNSQTRHLPPVVSIGHNSQSAASAFREPRSTPSAKLIPPSFRPSSPRMASCCIPQSGSSTSGRHPPSHILQPLAS